MVIIGHMSVKNQKIKIDDVKKLQHISGTVWLELYTYVKCLHQDWLWELGTAWNSNKKFNVVVCVNNLFLNRTKILYSFSMESTSGIQVSKFGASVGSKKRKPQPARQILIRRNGARKCGIHKVVSLLRKRTQRSIQHFADPKTYTTSHAEVVLQRIFRDDDVGAGLTL